MDSNVKFTEYCFDIYIQNVFHSTMYTYCSNKYAIIRFLAFKYSISSYNFDVYRRPVNFNL